MKHLEKVVFELEPSTLSAGKHLLFHERNLEWNHSCPQIGNRTMPIMVRTSEHMLLNGTQHYVG